MQQNVSTTKFAILSATLAAAGLLSACGGGNEEAADTAEMSTELAQAVTPTSTNGTWSTVAYQNSNFSVSGTRYVRFGTGTRWVGKYVTGSGACTIDFFGSNPAVGVGKQCDVFTENVTTTPTPVPAGTATLSWTAPTGSVAGYRVYYGKASSTYDQAKGSGTYTTTTNIKLSNLTSGTKYYFAVTAIDPAGNESAYSNEASKTTP